MGWVGVGVALSSILLFLFLPNRFQIIRPVPNMQHAVKGALGGLCDEIREACVGAKRIERARARARRGS